MYDLFRLIFQREEISHILLQITEVHFFQGEFAEGTSSTFSESMVEDSDLNSGKLEDTVYLTCPENFHELKPSCSGKYLNFFC